MVRPMAFYKDLQARLHSAADTPEAAADLVHRLEEALAALTQEDRADAIAANVNPVRRGELGRRRAELDGLLIAAREVQSGFGERDVLPLEGEDAEEVAWRRAQAGSPGDTLEIDVHKLMGDKAPAARKR
jgi:hypothetical protein